MRIVLVVLLLWVAGCGRSVSGDGGPVDVHSHERPGHPPNWPGVGDWGGLVSRPGGAPVVYDGTPVVQACDLLTPEDMHDLGLGIASGTSDGMVSHDRIDADGTVEPYPVSIHETPNHCFYPAAGDGLAIVAVHQPAYTGAETLRRHVEWYLGPPVDRGGVAVRERSGRSGDSAEHWLQLGEVHVGLVVDSSEDREEAVLEHVIRRLPQAVASPTGPRTFGYASPAFPPPFVDACAISAWSDVGELARGLGPSAEVEENLAPGIALVTYFDGVRTNFVNHSCRRRAEGDLRLVPSLTVHTKTFDVPEAPASDLAFERTIGGRDTAVPVGEESITTNKQGYVGVQFRRGLVVVELSYFDGLERLSPERVDALLPIAQAIDARLVG